MQPIKLRTSGRFQNTICLLWIELSYPKHEQPKEKIIKNKEKEVENDDADNDKEEEATSDDK